MAESMVTDPIYLDETAKANGAKLDLLNATMLGVSASLGVLAKAQTGIFEEMDYNAIKAVVDAADGTLVKVIIETCLLTDEEKVKACELAKEAGADFVKTSTGFSTGGAKAEDVALMRKTVGDDMGVKASGGIHTAEEAQAMIDAGASRLGTSATLAIIGK